MTEPPLYTLFNVVTTTTTGQQQRRRRTSDDEKQTTTTKKRNNNKKEIIKAPVENKKTKKTILPKGCGRKQQQLISLLLQGTQNSVKDYFTSTKAIVKKNNNKICKQFIECVNVTEENLNEIIKSVKRENDQLSKTGIFTDECEKREFYVLRFLCKVPTTWNIFEEIDNVLEEHLKNINVNIILNVKPGRKISVKNKKKKKENVTTTGVEFDKEFIEISIPCPSKYECFPYYIQNGKLFQTNRYSNIHDKYTVFCIYLLIKYIRNMKHFNYTTVNCSDFDSRIIIVNCHIKSIFLELLSDHYYCQCIRFKFGGIVNYIVQK